MRCACRRPSGSLGAGFKRRLSDGEITDATLCSAAGHHLARMLGRMKNDGIGASGITVRRRIDVYGAHEWFASTPPCKTGNRGVRTGGA